MPDIIAWAIIFHEGEIICALSGIPVEFHLSGEPVYRDVGRQTLKNEWMAGDYSWLVAMEIYQKIQRDDDTALYSIIFLPDWNLEEQDNHSITVRSCLLEMLEYNINVLSTKLEEHTMRW